MGEGGANNSAVVYPQVARTLEARHDSSPCIDRGQNIVCIHDKATRHQGGGDSRNDDGGGNGLGISTDGIEYTLTAADRHAVAFMAGQGAKAGSIAASETVSPTLKGVASGLNQIPSICFSPKAYVDYAEQMPLLRANGGDVGGGSEGVVVQSYQKVTGPLMANSHPGSYSGQDAYTDMLVAGKTSNSPRKYIVRRLTPMECARLQGLPDCWGELAPYDCDDEFWEKVRKTQCEINGTKYRPKSKEALKKWYEGLRTDSAEYKMYGNGIAVPCAEFVLGRIAEAEREKAL
jgi:DNA (cytosine-5)-methyltransferase 1